MTYGECLAYLYRQLPQYQRTGAAAYKADLSNTISMLDRLGNPQSGLAAIHVAGTNGKGSVSHMLASILFESGIKTGLYTSPHLLDFRERVRVNGEMIPEKTVVGFVEKYRHLVEDIRPSFFEWTVALAFWYFRESGTGLAVIETGLGGRLDSTNVITPLLSIITNIGLDHTQFLGDSLEKIAMEKAGIIKSGVPVVIGQDTMVTREIFVAKARSAGSTVVFAADRKLADVEGDLRGPYQSVNRQTVLHAIEELRKAGIAVSDGDVSRGMAGVRKNTGLRGRWEWLKSNVLADVAHNAGGIEVLMSGVAGMKFDSLHIVLGMSSDKPLESMLELMPRNATYYFCRADIPRSLDQEELKSRALQSGLSGKSYSSVKEAYRSALEKAGDSDLVVVTGSVFVVAEVLA